MPGLQALQGLPLYPIHCRAGTLTPLRRPEGRPPYILALRGVEDAAPYNIQHSTKRHLPTRTGAFFITYYRSHFQKWQLYGSSVLPPPKSWSAPVMRSTARPQPASKWASNGLPSALMATSTRSPSA